MPCVQMNVNGETDDGRASECVVRHRHRLDLSPTMTVGLEQLLVIKMRMEFMP